MIPILRGRNMTRERAQLLGPELAEAGRRIGAQLRGGTAVNGDPAVAAVEGAWAFDGAFPRWHAATGRLYWADRLAPSLRAMEDSGDRVVLETESPVTGLAFRGDDVLLAHAEGVLRVTADGLCAPVTAWPAGLPRAGRCVLLACARCWRCSRPARRQQRSPAQWWPLRRRAPRSSTCWASGLSGLSAVYRPVSL